MFSTERTNDSVRIYILKREVAEMRRAVLPLREPMRRFAAGMVTGIDPEAAPFFRDVADHLIRVAETIDSLDSLSVVGLRRAPRPDHRSSRTTTCGRSRRASAWSPSRP